MKKFEYKIAKQTTAITISMLNEIGGEGWEVVSILIVTDNVTVVFFKREIEEDN